MQDATNKSQAHTQKLTAEIKKAFQKLNDADIALQATSPDKFYEAVKTKQGIEKNEAEKTIKKLDAECAAACAANKTADANAKPAPKAANA
jgi:uridine phosphorylase